MPEMIPFPGIIQGPDKRPWKVIPLKKGGIPRVIFNRREVHVPIGDTALAHDARLHEMGHVAWTPPELIASIEEAFPTVHAIFVQAAEDARINTNLANIGIPLTAKLMGSAAKAKIRKAVPADQLCIYLAAKGTPDEDDVRGLITPMVATTVDALLDRVGIRREKDFVSGPEATEELIKTLSMLFGEGGDPSELQQLYDQLFGEQPPPGMPQEGEGQQQGQPVESPEGQEAEGQGTAAGESKPSESKPKSAPKGKSLSKSEMPSKGKDESKVASKPDVQKAQQEWKTTITPKEPPAWVRPAVKYRAAPSTMRPVGRTSQWAHGEITTANVKAMESVLAAVTASGDGVRPVPKHIVQQELGGSVVKSGVKIPETVVHAYGNWCEMRILDLVRPNRVPVRMRGRKHGVDTVGAIPVAPHRATSDQRVFRASRIKPMAGCVLIDNSGSMGFSGSDVLKIMEMLPAATIADYCATGSYGELRILASKGKTVKREVLDVSCGAGNGVDGPALRWLIQQKGPRFWVSDGGVTGAHDTSITNGGEECLTLCRAGKVIQVQSIDQLHHLLRSGKLSLRRHPPLREADRPPYQVLCYGGYKS